MAWLSNSLDVHQHPWPDPTPQGIIYLDDSFTFQERKTKERTNTTKTEKNLTNTLHITKSWNSHVTREAVTWKNWSKQNKNQASNLYWKNWSKQKKNQAKNRYYKTENLKKTVQINKRTIPWNSHVTRQCVMWRNWSKQKKNQGKNQYYKMCHLRKTDQNRRKTKERTNTTKTETNLTNILHITKSWNSHVTR